MIKITKQLAVKEDLELGFGEVDQQREIADGSLALKTYHKINAGTIPAKSDAAVDSDVQTELLLRITQAQGDVRYAKLNGNSGEIFKVADPVDDADAINKHYFVTNLQVAVDSLNSNKADKNNVLELDNTDSYIPTTDYHPVTKKYVDGVLVAIGAGDMPKSVYDKNDDGVVDDSEAIGGVAADNVHMLRTGALDANSNLKQGDWNGTAVTGAPSQAEVLLSSFRAGHRGYQLSADDERLWLRVYNGSGWDNWGKLLTEKNIINNVGSVSASDALAAKQGKVLYDMILNIEGVPSGTIVMWNKPVAPQGWFLCDGANNTPNLRDKFVKGASTSSQLGKSGGTKNATMPDHTHTANHSHTASSNTTGNHYHTANHNHSATASVSVKSGGSHTHVVDQNKVGFWTSVCTGGGAWGRPSGTPEGKTHSAGSHGHSTTASVSVATKNVNTSTTGNHKHTITVATKSFSTGTAHSGGNNEPQNVILFFIMKA